MLCLCKALTKILIELYKGALCTQMFYLCGHSKIKRVIYKKAQKQTDKINAYSITEPLYKVTAVNTTVKLILLHITVNYNIYCKQMFTYS